MRMALQSVTVLGESFQAAMVVRDLTWEQSLLHCLHGVGDATVHAGNASLGLSWV